MEIQEIKTGMLVVVSSLIENEIDGVKRRKGAIGMVDTPVSNTCGIWWCINHQDGIQIKYRYCEISNMHAIQVGQASGEVQAEKAES